MAKNNPNLKYQGRFTLWATNHFKAFSFPSTDYSLEKKRTVEVISPGDAAVAGMIEDLLSWLLSGKSLDVALEANEARSTRDLRRGPERGRLLLADPGWWPIPVVKIPVLVNDVVRATGAPIRWRQSRTWVKSNMKTPGKNKNWRNMHLKTDE